jgi:2-polyprenyl-6-methoxyphenol hydroxylase-like FAD-dependent oxidoreductase
VDVIIIGAGIAGLATALELDRVGIKARVYESVEELRPFGVGINLLPHASRVLGECGLLDALADSAVATNEPSIMRAAEAIYEYPCVDRDPLERWTFGRITLLGDAAHPMYPMGSNGASQAILDAKALANTLMSEPDIDRALAAYEAARRPATAEIVLGNRRQGPSEIQTIVEQRAPNGFDNIERVLSTAERARISERYKRMAGFDQASVNADVP